MDSPPVPKPRSAFLPQSIKKPVPLPRTKVPISNDRVSVSNIVRSLSSASKQLTEGVASKVTSSAKAANEKIEKSFQDGTKLANRTFEKTIVTSKAVRDSVAKSVIEGTRSAGFKLRRTKNTENIDNAGIDRCISMPIVDVSLFDNIQFHSPLLEQKRYGKEGTDSQNDDIQSLYRTSPNLDSLEQLSSSLDSNPDNVSHLSFSCESNTDNDHSDLSIYFDSELKTYDTPRPSRHNSIASTMSSNDISNLQQNANSREMMRQNSLYENLILPSQELNNEDTNQPRKSTIFEFDPLNSTKTANKYEGVSNEVLLSESFDANDMYLVIISKTNEETFDMSEYFNSPTPPERSDSLLTNEFLQEASSSREGVKYSNSNFYVSPKVESKTMEEAKPSSVMQKFTSMLKLDSKKNIKQVDQKVTVVEQPSINSLPVLFYSGMLTRIVSGVVEDLFKNSQSRYCILTDHKLFCYIDSTKSIIKEMYTLDNFNSVQILLPHSSSTTNNSYCFEVGLTSVAPRGNCRGTHRKLLFSCSSASERQNWAQKIAENLTSAFSSKYTVEFTRCGWCYLKEGVTGEWRGAWLMLVRRMLIYCCNNATSTSSVDLRKTRCVVMQDADDETKQACPSDDSRNLLLDCPDNTLYLRFLFGAELNGWSYRIKLAAHNNGAHIHHQQLTKEDVPTVVDKCISFIYAHGSLSEGIYRRAGSSVVLTELLLRFRKNAWSVQLTPGQHSEHDVAGVLKRFFRDLPVSLIPQSCHEDLISALEIKEDGRRYAEYRRTLNTLSTVERNTARALFAHLHFLHTMAHANKMNAENLAAVWAPTIMPAAMTSNTLQTAWSTKEVYVVRDLISKYVAVWRPTEEERERSLAVQRVLARVLATTAPAKPCAAGDLRVWLYVHDRTNCYQVAVTPNKTSADVCLELSGKAKMDSHLLMLEEVICNESMRRIVHLNEVVLDVVLRWGYWDEEDRKDNYLIVRENKILHEMDALKHSTSLVCGELRLATESSKAFKLHMFEFNKTKLCYFKDKQGSHKIEEWDIKDILWYTGSEPKRNPQSRWAITFIPRNNKPKRSKERPWFGCTIAGAVTEDQLKWITAMTFAEYDNILPTPLLVIT